jgi:hypothetical protein
VAVLEDGRVRPLPREVARQRVGLAGQPKALQRLEDLDAEAADRGAQRPALEGIGEASDRLGVALPQGDEPVEDPEVRVDPEARDGRGR